MHRILSRSVLLSLCLLLPLLAASANGQTADALNNTSLGGHSAHKAIDALPPGFIALSESRMNWEDAVTYCWRQGGRLPRINNSNVWDGTADSDSIMLDAFGTLGDDWPVDLPRAYYWTGTLYSADPDYVGYAWGVRIVRDGIIGVIGVKAEDTLLRVVCTPQ